MLNDYHEIIDVTIALWQTKTFSYSLESVTKRKEIKQKFKRIIVSICYSLKGISKEEK